jgi:hypothetical protein
MDLDRNKGGLVGQLPTQFGTAGGRRGSPAAWRERQCRREPLPRPSMAGFLL